MDSMGRLVLTALSVMLYLVKHEVLYGHGSGSLSQVQLAGATVLWKGVMQAQDLAISVPVKNNPSWAAAEQQVKSAMAAFFSNPVESPRQKTMTNLNTGSHMSTAAPAVIKGRQAEAVYQISQDIWKPTRLLIP